ncbi:hypothetical protein COOONC_19689 [Cooperia oncophora]
MTPPIEVSNGAPEASCETSSILPIDYEQLVSKNYVFYELPCGQTAEVTEYPAGIPRFSTFNTTAGFEYNSVKGNVAAGLAHVDGYIFPCLSSSCPSASKQVSETVTALKNAGTTVGMLWLDIETYAWPSDHTKNRAFIEEMGKELTSLGQSWGVYSNYNNWQSIVGLDYTGMKSKQLWWATYNNEAVSGHTMLSVL